MPKKRSIKPGYSKGLQRLHKRAAFGPSLPPEETPAESPDASTEGAGTPKTHIDIQRLVAAQKKRLRKAQKALRLRKITAQT